MYALLCSSRLARGGGSSSLGRESLDGPGSTNFLFKVHGSSIDIKLHSPNEEEAHKGA